MKVANVVDEEAHGSGQAILLGVIHVGMVHDFFVFISILVAWCLGEPHSQSIDDFGNIMTVEFEIEVTNVTALVEVWLINEMPSFLVPALLLSLDEVGVGGALSEWMLILIDREIWISFLESVQNGKGVVVSCRVLLLENLLGNSGSEQVTVVPPCAGC